VIEKIIYRLKLSANMLRYGGAKLKIEREIPTITDDEVIEARAFFPLDKFFIFGHARSGTTLLTRLIRLHPEVHCNYQGHFFTRQPTLGGLVADPDVHDWLSRRSNRWNRGRDLSPVVLRAVSDFIMEREARREHARVIGDKSPNSLLDGEAVNLMHKIYPDGKLIFIVRDGRDAAISHRFQSFIDRERLLSKQDLAIRADFESDPDAFLRGKRSIFTEKIIRTAAKGWRQNITQTDERGKVLYGQQYISLRYEDLLADPWNQMSRLWEFLSVDISLPVLKARLKDEISSNPDKEWQQEQAAKLIGPLQKGKSGSWRDLFTARDQAVFQEIAGDILYDWDYKAH
jgi:LPS sulfotransferase NodH